MSNKKTISIFSQVFYPDPSATSKLLTDIALGVSTEFAVNVYTQNRSYINPKVRYNSHDRINLPNTSINRFNVPPLNKNKFLSKILLSYLVSKNMVKKAIDASNKSDLFLCVSNPPNLPHKIGSLAKKYNIPFVYLLHDLYPDELIKNDNFSSKNFLVKSIIEYSRKSTLESFLTSDKIIVIGRDVKDLISTNYKIDSSKIVVITNWARRLDIDFEESKKIRNRFNLDGKFVIMYAGNVGILQDFSVILSAMKELQKIDKDIIFVIVGNGSQKQFIINFCNQNKLENIKLIDFITDEKEFSSVLSIADCCFVSLNKELYGTAVPSKTYYYLSAGKPILGLLPKNSEIDLEIKEDGFGLVCNDYSYKSLIDIILELKNDKTKLSLMSIKAKNVFDNKYSKEVVIQKYLNLFQEMLS